MTYNVSYDASNVAAGTLGGMLVLYSIISIALIVFSIIVMWKLFEKAGKPGWAAIVPFYNLYVFFEITWGNGWLFLLILLAIIPIAGSIAVCVIMIITMVKLAKVFGKSGGFAVGLVFLSLIFEAILAFGDSKYVGIDGLAAQEVSNTVPPVEPTVPSVEEKPEATVEPETTTEQTEETTSTEENNNF